MCFSTNSSMKMDSHLSRLQITFVCKDGLLNYSSCLNADGVERRSHGLQNSRRFLLWLLSGCQVGKAGQQMKVTELDVSCSSQALWTALIHTLASECVSNITHTHTVVMFAKPGFRSAWACCNPAVTIWTGTEVRTQRQWGMGKGIGA